MKGTQAQAESEHRYWLEDEMTQAEQIEFEKWCESVYWSMRAEEAERGEDF